MPTYANETSLWHDLNFLVIRMGDGTIKRTRKKGDFKSHLGN